VIVSEWVPGAEISFAFDPDVMDLTLGGEVLPANAAARNAAGWDSCLDRLVGLAPETDAWQPRFSAYAARFAPVLGHQDGPPEGYKGKLE
jgi:hypothetical protein